MVEHGSTENPWLLSEDALQHWWSLGLLTGQLLRTDSGRSLHILEPGRWNRGEGPDFRNALIELDGFRRTGDIEVHFSPRDWFYHGHQNDPRYRKVLLHVVLAPEPGGPSLPTLSLLPFLDSEELPEPEPLPQWSGLERAARFRWQQKVSALRRRVSRLGWSEACHMSLLEALGFRRNRVPMMRLAARFPLSQAPVWQSRQPEELFAIERKRWAPTGVRPANHPRTRLAQYRELARQAPDWPIHLRDTVAELANLPPFCACTGRFRQRANLRELRERLLDVLANQWTGSRGDTVLGDVLFPLAAVLAPDAGWYGCWFHGYLGDVPQQVRALLRDVGLSPAEGFPWCHGLAQGGLANPAR